MSDVVYQGQTLAVWFGPVKDPMGKVVKLPGASILCKVQRQDGTGPEIAASFGAVIDADLGSAQGVFTPVQTAAFDLGTTYSADANAVLATGEVVPLGKVAFKTGALISID